MRNRLKYFLKAFNNGERGMVLPIVMILLLLVALLIPPLMSLIGTSLVTGQMHENSSYELYAADAGVMDATWLLQGAEIPGEGRIDPAEAVKLFGDDGIYTYPNDDYPDPLVINGKTVTYKIVRDGVAGYSFIITSIATGTDGSTTTIETQVQYLPPPPPIMVAVGALDGNLKINADVGTEDKWLGIYANGDIDMIGSGQIYGDAYYTAGHTVSPPSSGVFHGREIETVELELVEGVLPENPKNSGLQYTHIGNMDISETGVLHELGPVYITGDLTISADVQVELKGTVWVAGKIKINDTAVVYGKYEIGDISPGDESLYTKYETGNPYFMITDYNGNGDAISVNGSTPAGYDYKVEAIMYAPDGDIYIGGNASIDGSAVGKEVDILGDSRLNFPLAFERVDPGPNPMVFNYWKIS